MISATPRRPAKIASLVYVAAYLPRVGTTPATRYRNSRWPIPTGPGRRTASCRPPVSTASVNLRDRTALFANDAEPDGQAIADAMVDEPLAPLATPCRSPPALRSVRKAYVVTLRDEAVSTDFQLTMLAGDRSRRPYPSTAAYSADHPACAPAEAIRRRPPPKWGGPVTAR